MELEGHWEYRGRFGGGFHPVGRIEVELHMGHWGLDRRIAVEPGDCGPGCYACWYGLLALMLNDRLGVMVVDGEGTESIGEGGGLRGLDWLSGDWCLGFLLDSCLDGIGCPEDEGGGFRLLMVFVLTNHVGVPRQEGSLGVLGGRVLGRRS